MPDSSLALPGAVLRSSCVIELVFVSDVFDFDNRGVGFGAPAAPTAAGAASVLPMSRLTIV